MASAVHPHACGERVVNHLFGIGQGGSSPRLWGTDQTPNSPTTSFRFIPTPVGNGKAKVDQKAKMAVHPHACGERFWLASILFERYGSSPRLWGTALLLNISTSDARFIPTPVGNGSALLKISRSVSVHPHACGERSASWISGISGIGSSPRLWGTGFAARVLLSLGRFIPTPVGNGK